MTIGVYCNGMLVLRFGMNEPDPLWAIHYFLGLGNFNTLWSDGDTIDTISETLTLTIDDISKLERYLNDWNVEMILKKYENSNEDESGNIIFEKIKLSEEEFYKLQVASMVEKCLWVMESFKERGYSEFVFRAFVYK